MEEISELGGGRLPAQGLLTSMREGAGRGGCWEDRGVDSDPREQCLSAATLPAHGELARVCAILPEGLGPVLLGP